MNINSVCKNCLGWMLTHPELEDWLKCVCCGFSKKVKNTMLSLKEIIHCGKAPEELDSNKLGQCNDLLDKVNSIRTIWGKPMTVTSGVRTWEDHLRIYADKGITDLNKIPKKSKHLETVTDAAAVDISDPGLELTTWLKDTPEGQKALEDADLYCELGNSNWLHVQNKPFGSYKPGGTRWFNP